MCGIIVSESKEFDVLLKKDTLINRGPDQELTIIEHGKLFSFHRLSIMDLSDKGMQPFTYKGNILVANAEIYNHKEIRSELSFIEFKSTSDCEVLLPYYEKYREHMFSYLDAEFAIVLYDKDEDCLVAGRDPIGIRPLFYGYHKKDDAIVFASEMKTIVSCVKKVYPFPPGHYYKKGHFIKYSELLEVTEYQFDDLENTTKNIREKLEAAVVKRVDSDAPLGFLLSGGLDSSLVCAIAQRNSIMPIKTFSIGMDTDPIDLKYAKRVAKYLGTEHTEVSMSKEEVLSSIENVIYSIESYDITTIRASIGMYILAKYINENTNIKVLLTGEVSDELFGYKYTDFAPSAESFQLESIKRVKELYMYDVLRADRCLAANSLEARVPFADINFMHYVLRILPSQKMNTYNMGKYLLRKAFEGEYLPHSILYRDKAAFSDAVGHSMVDYIKEFTENQYTDEEFAIKKRSYKPVPISKEALYYREVFEKFYPRQSHVITDYWMPNKDWDGCDVSDPSARVLSNYGASGE